MLRIILLITALAAVVALLTRSQVVLRVIYAVCALLAIYAVLKVTGVIEMIAPDRDGVISRANLGVSGYLICKRMKCKDKNC